MPTVLFLRAPSPGALFVFVERFAPTAARPAIVRLSDPAPPNGWRAVDLPAALADTLAERLATAFGPEIARLDWGADGWRWARGEASGGGATPRSSAHWLTRLPGWPQSPAPWAIWAQEQGLPLARLTDPRVPEVDYATVAGLDQRLLLEERSPRIYRFELSAPV